MSKKKKRKFFREDKNMENNNIFDENTITTKEVVNEIIENEEVNNTFENELIEETNVNEPKIIIGTVIPKFLNIRREPSKDSEIISIVNENDEIKIVNDLGEFYRVIINDGLEGYCVKEFISIR